MVSGIFSTGIEEFDSNLVLGSFSLLNNLFDQSGVNQFNIQLKPNVSEQETIKNLKTGLGSMFFHGKSCIQH